VSRVIDEHRHYLRDRHRVSAYDRAIREVVRPGDVVVDVASGTGILGLLACRAGASRVYAIEQSSIAGLARQIAKANGFEHIITSVRGYSRLVTIPERADVVVCDQIGGFGLEAGIFELAKDVRQRFLRPGGTLVPSTVELVVAAVEHSGLHGRLRFWKGRPAGFDCTPAVEIAANTGYPVRMRPEHLLSAPVSGATLDLTIDQALPLRVSGALRASRDGVLHGIAGWFVARLSPHVTMTNSPMSAERIYRRQVFFPIEEPVTIEAGATIDVAMRILPTDSMYAWDVRVSPLFGPPVTFRHTTLRGMLLAREDLTLTNPAHQPVLTPAGIARLTVLRLCDGSHTLADIERAVYEEHENLFSSREEAAVFVAEVVTRYGR
jgi:Arginine methyltransferase oligomerization subdomain/Ribosomal protein L11 methyltransferase (PrmA)